MTHIGFIIQLVLMLFFFMMFLFGVYSYYSFKTMELHNQLSFSKENFRVMVNSMTNAIISETQNSNFGYCNTVGLEII